MNKQLYVSDVIIKNDNDEIILKLETSIIKGGFFTILDDGNSKPAQGFTTNIDVANKYAYGFIDRGREYGYVEYTHLPCFNHKDIWFRLNDTN